MTALQTAVYLQEMYARYRNRISVTRISKQALHYITKTTTFCVEVLIYFRNVRTNIKSEETKYDSRGVKVWLKHAVLV
jgi:hypothetical protein